jgi:hypothetical protein
MVSAPRQFLVIRAVELVSGIGDLMYAVLGGSTAARNRFCVRQA